MVGLSGEVLVYVAFGGVCPFVGMCRSGDYVYIRWKRGCVSDKVDMYS